jgi:hypothetical protein
MDFPPENGLTRTSGKTLFTIPSGRLTKESNRKQRFDVTTGGNAAEWNVFHCEMVLQPYYRLKLI